MGTLSETIKHPPHQLLHGSLCMARISSSLPSDCLHEVGNLLWKSQHHVSTAWYFWFNCANHSVTNLSAPLESDISCQELLTRLQGRKRWMGATGARTPKRRGMMALPGNPSSRASLLGEASQRRNFYKSA